MCGKFDFNKFNSNLMLMIIFAKLYTMYIWYNIMYKNICVLMYMCRYKCVSRILTQFIRPWILNVCLITFFFCINNNITVSMSKLFDFLYRYGIQCIKCICILRFFRQTLNWDFVAFIIHTFLPFLPQKFKQIFER